MGHCTVRQYLEDYIKEPTLLKVTYEGQVFLFHPHVLGIHRDDNEWYTEGTKVEQVKDVWQNVGWFKIPTEKILAEPQKDIEVPGISDQYDSAYTKAQYRKIGFAQRKEA
ncbi:MAG TPA: hypothetical protein DCE41_33885 [Cytophagales bacterium]|nr:hypothetical protein [Cytophagales bacterium]HAA17986.1 hypothetical protein [Cytophagales bacterium]HAP64731.1 hypothetical protein [Cytophagales bacterium]